MTSMVSVFARVWSHLFKLKVEPSIGPMPWMKKAWKMSVLASSFRRVMRSPWENGLADFQEVS